MSSEQHESSVDRAVRDLRTASPVASVAERIELCRRCIAGIEQVADNWVSEAAGQKGHPDSPVARAEEMLGGPVIVVRQLRLTIQTLESLQRTGRIILPSPVRSSADHRTIVPIFPTRGLYDILTFMGLRAEVRMQDGVGFREIHGDRLKTAGRETFEEIAGVLGAGNVSSIPLLDSLNRIMFDNRCVILKMNPVNAYLTPFFRKAFHSLIAAGLLRIVEGDGDVGQAVVHHPDVCEIHITGAGETHDRIVWGDGPERVQRKSDHNPLLNKEITSELGNVTPWIIVPGQYTRRQLASQAAHISASITNNASFNCLTTRVLVTCRNWPQREEFLHLIQQTLKQTPRRRAYYPGALQRYVRFSGIPSLANLENPPPWTLLEDQRPSDRPELFQEEAFAPVCSETRIEAATATEFLTTAVDFVNQQLTGTLCSSVTIPAGFDRKYPEAILNCCSELRYGAVCFNQWSGLVYGLVSPPWGAYPGSSLQNVESGIGNVHNTYLLARPEKTILRGPLVNFPKPAWLPSHRNASSVAERLLKLYCHPSPVNLPALFLAALRG